MHKFANYICVLLLCELKEIDYATNLLCIIMHFQKHSLCASTQIILSLQTNYYANLIDKRVVCMCMQNYTEALVRICKHAAYLR